IQTRCSRPHPDILQPGLYPSSLERDRRRARMKHSTVKPAQQPKPCRSLRASVDLSHFLRINCKFKLVEIVIPAIAPCQTLSDCAALGGPTCGHHAEKAGNFRLA